MTPPSLLSVALPLALSLLLGGVFAAAAIPKLRHPKGFLLTVLDYRILGERASRMYAWIVPPFELVAALLLVAGVAVRGTALLLGLLLISFLVAVGVNVARGRELDCGCFGAGKGTRASRRIGPGLLLQDLGLLAAALLLAAATPDWFSPSAWSVALALARFMGTPLAVAMVFVACLALAGWLTYALSRPGTRVGGKRARAALGARRR